MLQETQEFNFVLSNMANHEPFTLTLADNVVFTVPYKSRVTAIDISDSDDGFVLQCSEPSPALSLYLNGGNVLSKGDTGGWEATTQPDGAVLYSWPDLRNAQRRFLVNVEEPEKEGKAIIVVVGTVEID
jgi:hypothetical protein